ncbi:venom serine carboxypeptidase-like [Venturia canescens]|uniref:venom serine carboxypeptidase-like n=1 Tax=Venturia canescens TaxID=32260 RepID=UPI001C9C2A25|nr:venom serine carboxypeptidase-like [Venturia canescens]
MWRLGILSGLVLASFVAGQLNVSSSRSDCVCICIDESPKGDRCKHTDTGEALYLTPLLEAGQVDSARSQAEVDARLMCNVKSYAGYFTVDKLFNSNLFFWYFPAKHNSVSAPVVLYLEGGPGVTSFFSLFFQNGPFSMGSEKGCLELRSESWTNKHNVIYIDSPVGTGYSFTDWSGALSTEAVEVGDKLRDAMVQFFELFPALRSNDFFVAGESYAGKFVPPTAYAITSYNKIAKEEKRINLKGIAIANGYTDPLNQLVYGDYLYEMGLIDANGREQFLVLEKEGRDLILEKQHSAAHGVFEKLIADKDSLFKNLTGYSSTLNILEINDPVELEAAFDWVKHPNVRRALHVGNNEFTPNSAKVYDRLRDDATQSQAHYVSALLEHYSVLIYTGHLNIICPYPAVQNYLQQLTWSGAEEFKTSKREFWRVAGGELAGYMRKAGNLREVLVLNAGHLSSRDQPRWTLELLEKFTHGSL